MPKSNTEYCKILNTMTKDIHKCIKEQMNEAHHEIQCLINEKNKEISNEIKSIMVRYSEDIHLIIDYWEEQIEEELESESESESEFGDCDDWKC